MSVDQQSLQHATVQVSVKIQHANTKIDRRYPHPVKPNCRVVGVMENAPGQWQRVQRDNQT